MSYTGMVPNTTVHCRAIGCQATQHVPMEPSMFRTTLAKHGWLLGPPQHDGNRHVWCPTHFFTGMDNK